MKHEIKVLGCWHVVLLISLVGAGALLTYGGLNWRQHALVLTARQHELQQQAQLYRQVLAEQADLKDSIGHLQQQLQGYLHSCPSTLELRAGYQQATDAAYLAQIMLLAQQAHLTVVTCDPSERHLALTGNFFNLLDWLEQLRQLGAAHFCKQLLITKTPKSLHIDYRYDMHTLAGLT